MTNRDKVASVVNYISGSRYCQVGSEEEAYKSFVAALKGGEVIITHKRKAKS